MADAGDTLAGTTGVAAPDNPIPLNQPSMLPDQSSIPVSGNTPTLPVLSTPSSPIQEVPQPQLTPTIPSETLPRNPDIERQYHESKWRQVLDRVGTILGGGETVHITKDADGNIQEIHMPSTGSEKWHRVAAAALGGAAAGLANSQGPGGLGKAAAAGVQYGLNVPKQEKENIDAQATAEQKRMQANANNALIHQDAYTKMLQSQQLKTSIDEKSAELLNAYRDDLESSPNAKDFGIISSEDDLMKIMNQNPEFFKSHTDLSLKAAMVPKAGGGFEIHAVATDPGDDARPIGKGGTRLKIDIDPVTHEPKLSSEAVSPSEKRGKIRMSDQAIIAQFAGLANKWTDLQTKSQAEKDRAAAATQAAQDRAQAAEDRRTYQQESIDERRQAHAETIGLQREIAQGKGFISGEPVPPAPWGSYDPDFAPLQNYPAGTEGINKSKIGKPTADVTRAARLGRSAIQNSTDAINIIQANPNLVGRLNSLGSRWQQAIGVSDNDPLTALQAAVEQSTQASLGAHNYRGTNYAQQKENEVTNHLKNDPGSIVSYLNERIKSNRQFVNEERRYNIYGTPYGPDPAHDVNRPKDGTPTPTTTPAAEPKPTTPAGGTTAPPPPPPTTHVFSKSAWLAAHPGGDVNAATQAATAQKYKVVD